MRGDARLKADMRGLYVAETVIETDHDGVRVVDNAHYDVSFATSVEAMSDAFSRSASPGISTCVDLIS